MPIDLTVPIGELFDLPGTGNTPPDFELSLEQGWELSHITFFL